MFGTLIDSKVRGLILANTLFSIVVGPNVLHLGAQLGCLTITLKYFYRFSNITVCSQ